MGLFSLVVRVGNFPYSQGVVPEGFNVFGTSVGLVSDRVDSPELS